MMCAGSSIPAEIGSAPARLGGVVAGASGTWAAVSGRPVVSSRYWNVKPDELAEMLVA